MSFITTNVVCDYVTKIVANYICNNKKQVKKYNFSSSELNWIEFPMAKNIQNSISPKTKVDFLSSKLLSIYSTH